LEAGEYKTNANRFIRRYLIERFGEKCARCGWAERHPKTGKVPVEVEHIDGDWRNNNPANLTLLCPNCHALTPTYRALNWGRGREYRAGGRENALRRKTAE
jgi:predicted HNH restriction endonuclease